MEQLGFAQMVLVSSHAFSHLSANTHFSANIVDASGVDTQSSSLATTKPFRQGRRHGNQLFPVSEQ